ncbi:DNA polymerase III subunit gamma/tau [Patescibacteria group bacterium]|nr:MAG: DNA polymerase III subunit gamma/tau [Patescibacteria group bacterium]
MARALYRKYRSKTLDEVVGQKHVTDILAQAIKRGRISHAYLLTGPRGVGKTSIARILAHEINQIPYDEDATNLDIIEIDAASNNGVEDVRDLREKVQIAPVSLPKKVYIIDEVHMLSKAAFNALLKTLEEPPEHVVFILATTDVDKLPATIISRTQRFSFRAIGPQDAVKHLRFIADSEKIKVDDESLELIAQRGDGSFRDSISLLDQLASVADSKTGITSGLIEASIGLAPKKIIDALLTSVEDHDIAVLVQLLDKAFDQGINGVILSQQLTVRVRELVVEKPQLLPLLDSLLDVAKSAQPNLKLLSVLGTAATPKTVVKSVALASPVLEVTATIAELEKKATQAKPKDPEALLSKSEDDKQVTQEAEADRVKQPSSTGFDSNALIEHTRKNYVAIYSVLSKCHFELEGEKLTIYAANKFYKKKLDDVKYSSLLYKALEEIGVYGLTIHTIPTAPPPKDSQAASVAAIMGGGEEVVVEDER